MSPSITGLNSASSTTPETGAVPCLLAAPLNTMGSAVGASNAIDAMLAVHKHICKLGVIH
jgi:hypothetical protein